MDKVEVYRTIDSSHSFDPSTLRELSKTTALLYEEIEYQIECEKGLTKTYSNLDELLEYHNLSSRKILNIAIKGRRKKDCEKLSWETSTCEIVLKSPDIRLSFTEYQDDSISLKWETSCIEILTNYENNHAYRKKQIYRLVIAFLVAALALITLLSLAFFTTTLKNPLIFSLFIIFCFSLPWIIGNHFIDKIKSKTEQLYPDVTFRIGHQIKIIEENETKKNMYFSCIVLGFIINVSASIILYLVVGI